MTFVHAILGIALLAGLSLNAADSFVQPAEERQRIEQALPTKAVVRPSTPRARLESVSFDHPNEIVRGQGFMVLADRRVFAVMAFLNAVGLDEESPGKPMHPVRVRVRELVTANLASCPDKVESWRRHYETHKLHSIINPIVEAHSGMVRTAVREYYEAGKDKPIVEPYRDPVGFTWECLIRALDHRLHALLSDTPESYERAEARMAQLHQQGLTLSQPFYRLLTQYEESDQPFDRFFPTMLERLPAYQP